MDKFYEVWTQIMTVFAEVMNCIYQILGIDKRIELPE